MATRVRAVWSNTTAGAKPRGRSPKPMTARVPADRRRATSGSESWSLLAVSAMGCIRFKVFSRRVTSSAAGSTSAV